MRCVCACVCMSVCACVCCNVVRWKGTSTCHCFVTIVMIQHVKDIQQEVMRKYYFNTFCNFL